MSEKQAENPRTAIREAREKKLRVIDGPPNTVKVYASNETIRASLRHANGTGFRAAIGEAVEWPNDNFTARRIADGSVRTDGPGSGEQAAPDESKNVREQSEANRATRKAATSTQKPPQPAA